MTVLRLLLAKSCTPGKTLVSPPSGRIRETLANLLQAAGDRRQLMTVLTPLWGGRVLVRDLGLRFMAGPAPATLFMR